MRLLIVDDGRYVVEYLKCLVDWNKYGITDVALSTNSIEALSLLDQKPTDILLTDIRMPEVSGLDLLRHIHDRQMWTQVIFLSGYPQFEYAQKAIRLGACDYLLKPVDKNDMEKAVDKAIRALQAPGADGPAVSPAPQEKPGSCLSDRTAVEAVQAYIQEHLESDLCLEKLGKFVHLHPVYLSRIYKKETGENLSDFIIQKRLEHSSELLMQTSLRISDIAHLLGYRKVQYFIKIFREQYGVTPNQYRRRHI